MDLQTQAQTLLREAVAEVRKNSASGTAAAHSLILKIYALVPPFFELEYMHALCLYKMGRFGQAREIFARLVENAPGDPKLERLLAESAIQERISPWHYHGPDVNPELLMSAAVPGAAGRQYAARVIEHLGRSEHKKRVLEIFSRLTPDQYLAEDIRRYVTAIESEAAFFDTPIFLNWFASNFKPKRFLEIGVRRGRSMAQVAVESPHTEIVGFDLWISDYGSVPGLNITVHNPGPDFVCEELRRLGVYKRPLLISGDSHATLPKYLADNGSSQMFDLINVDGDHSYEGALLDLSVTMQHLAPGGALVFDDITHPQHLDLMWLWEELKQRYPDYVYFETAHHTGTGVIMRPPLAALPEIR